MVVIRKNIVLAMFTVIFLIGSITILSFDTKRPTEPPKISIKWQNVLVSNITKKVRDKDTFTTKNTQHQQHIPGGDVETPLGTSTITIAAAQTLGLDDAANNGVPMIEDKNKEGGGGVGEEVNKGDEQQQHTTNNYKFNPFDRTRQSYEENRDKNIERANAVRSAMKFAWDKYVQFAMGWDELTPLSRKGKNWFHLGLSIVDGMDTLYFMGLEKEFEVAREWIATKLDHRIDTGEGLSVFEVTIRMLGGYLAMYEQTKDKMFLDKAEDIGIILLQAWPAGAAFPNTYINFAKGTSKIAPWTGGCLILADVGTLFIEFTHLSKVTGNPIYNEKATTILERLDSMNGKVDGLFPIYLNQNSFCVDTLSMGSMADSFYEYLLKMWMYTDDSHPQHDMYKRMYLDSVEGMRKHLYEVSKKGEGFLSINKHGTKTHTMEHLACMSGGMFALGVAANISGDPELNAIHLEMAENITNTCVQTYFNSKTGLGAETTYFDPADGSHQIYGHLGEAKYILRPETVESLFYLWRITGNPKYQDWGWTIFQSLEEHCKTPNGYVGLKDVNNPANKDDIQQSFFLAETMKYFYLLFADSSVVPLSEYVFNTEAHPIPYKKVW
ncbi:hypothetical protein SAMD00019534_066780 [Acytostelium subglobosum LB1]|uniref:hypothetical protein n=1 Tax=Acytostelium subglobosum LB1 TaxID=1410327 RepID=UPI000644CE4E|nr:hypothetical protein SAMD00019534_066780 [Acytostelium subglobosum LB1]GAM23503.1 hypothetical protein SAMD00019534_066780 [Acytostelium subglobosum LB1]|eukprot:XP_012753244.1 hypothetical protein SAMD00019534_066780 [Acytostelium subglobosum LB1]